MDKTQITFIDGEKGVLKYRGSSIEFLIQHSFEYASFLLLMGRSPSKQEEALWAKYLLQNSVLSLREKTILSHLDPQTHPMLVLQGMIPLLETPDRREKIEMKNFDSYISLSLYYIGKISAILSYWNNPSSSDLDPEFDKSFLYNFLYRFHGRRPSQKELRTFETVQILQLDHGFNASTFAARVTASTQAPLKSCLSCAIGTLFGKLHGGADEAALRMTLEIAAPENVKANINQKLQNKEKIMGIGHRVYTTLDPRAKILKPMAKELCEDTPFENLYKTLEEIEKEVESYAKTKGKVLKANIEFYKGAVYYPLGFSPIYFTPLFAFARSFGYCAHIIEAWKSNVLIRPKAKYMGN